MAQLTAVTQIQSLAWEHPYASSAAERGKKKKKNAFLRIQLSVKILLRKKTESKESIRSSCRGAVVNESD